MWRAVGQMKVRGEEIEKIELKEMVRDLRKLKNGKSPVCENQLELFKAGG